MPHANSFVLCANSHPLIRGTTEGRLGRLLVKARAKLRASDGTVGGLASQYAHHVPPDQPEELVTRFVSYWFSDYHLVKKEDHDV